jgi:hypothetical protein
VVLKSPVPTHWRLGAAPHGQPIHALYIRAPLLQQLSRLTITFTADLAAIEDAVYDSPGHLFRARIILLATLLGL